MSLTQIVVLAVVQGITEFLPISSSGHLILVPVLMGWPDQGLALDVANHVGSLSAVIVYFWRDVRDMALGFFALLRGHVTPGTKLMLLLIIGTIPAVIFGLVIKHFFPDGIRSITVIGVQTIVFAVILYIADRVSASNRGVADLRIRDALYMGAAQCLALIPGTSRSGVTMTCGRFLGLERREAARFSFLLAIPAISGAGVLEGKEMLETADASMLHDAALIAGFSFLSSFAAIWFLMAWLRRSAFTPFVVYRLILGVAVLALAFGFIG
ncbi:MAG: undecaprenyl-diphosphate phosphatase [Rhodospirillales bacterium]